MYVAIVLVVNMMGLSLPINAFNVQLTAVVIDKLLARVLHNFSSIYDAYKYLYDNIPHGKYLGAKYPWARAPG